MFFAHHRQQGRRTEDGHEEAAREPLAATGVLVQQAAFRRAEGFKVEGGVERWRWGWEAARGQKGEVVRWTRQVECDQVDEREVQRLAKHRRGRVEHFLDVLRERRNWFLGHDAERESAAPARRRRCRARVARGGELRPVGIAASGERCGSGRRDALGARAGLGR